MALNPTDRHGPGSYRPALVGEDDRVSETRRDQEGDEEALIRSRCHAAAYGALHAPMFGSSIVILNEYAMDHRAFFNNWERRFDDLWRYNRSGEHVDGAQGATIALGMVEEYTKARDEFLSRWSSGLHRAVQRVGDEPTRFTAEKILKEAHMREHIFNIWLHQISRGDNTPPAERGDIEVGAVLAERAPLSSAHVVISSDLDQTT